MTTCRKRTDHRPMDGHDPKCANLRALPSVANAHAMRLIDWQIQSSPHVRGTLETLAQLVFERGIIPACARDTCRVAGSPACRGDHLRMCGEHANVCVFMTYLQQNLLAYPEHLSMLQNPIQHWFSCFSLHQFCFCLAGCHDALQPRRHTDVQLFSPNLGLAGDIPQE